jgi:serine/threonine protein kinase
MIGEVLGGYKVLSKLGEGATGETYLAAHQETGQKAAAKVLFPAMSADRAILDRFFAEVRASSQVNHVGIADLFDCGVHGGGRAFLVMEFLEGKTLTDALIELGSVSDIESFADIGWQLATMLAATHASKIVHGALKPDAIFLTFPPAQAPRPLVKLVDFGMARFSLSVRHSQTGSLLGAPLYMSPEIGRGLGNVDHRADVYSLGCILFEMACGRPPFVREGKGELIIAHATETAPSVSSLEPAIPQAIDTLIGRMLTKNPATRPQGMGEVAAMLEKFFACPVPSGAQAAPQAAAVTPRPVVLAAPVYPQVPAMVPPSPSVVEASVPVPEIKSAPRRLEPTALLLPGEGPSSLSRPDLPRAPVAPQPWAARVQQRTAILEPPSASRPRPAPTPRSTPVVRAQLRDKPHRDRATPVRRPSVPAPRRWLPVSIPVIIATASIIIAIGASVLLLARRKPPKPEGGNAPANAPAKVEFRPVLAPRPEAAEYLPTAPANPVAPKADQVESLERNTGRGGPRPTGAGRPKPASPRPAPRW